MAVLLLTQPQKEAAAVAVVRALLAKLVAVQKVAMAAMVCLHLLLEQLHTTAAAAVLVQSMPCMVLVV
jgi:hypothetical protein